MKKYLFKNLELSNFCLGCAQFGQKYGINNEKELKEKEIKLIVKKAINSGVNFFDTAPDYGKSEEILGKNLIYFKDLVIATKIKYIKENIENPKIIEKEIKNSLESSLKKLQVDCLDFVYIHQCQLFFKFPETFLKILEEYKKRGFIKYIGISLYDPIEIDKTIIYDEIDIFQVPYNVLNKSFEENKKIELLQSQNKLIVLRSIFLQGLFFISPSELPEYFNPIKPTLKILNSEIKKEFKSKEEFLLGNVLNKNYGPIILGIYSFSQLINNLKVFNSSFSEDLFNKVEKRIPKINKNYIDPRKWN